MERSNCDHMWDEDFELTSGAVIECTRVCSLRRDHSGEHRAVTIQAAEQINQQEMANG